VALRWYVEAVDSAPAIALLEGDDPLLAPDLVVAEVSNAAWNGPSRRFEPRGPTTISSLTPRTYESYPDRLRPSPLRAWEPENTDPSIDS
jgi:hypothetical protein